MIEMTEVEANLIEIVRTEVRAEVIEIVMTEVEAEEMMVEDIIMKGTEIGIQEKGTERKEDLPIEKTEDLLIEKTEEGTQEKTEMVTDLFMKDLAQAVVTETETETEEDTIENPLNEGATRYVLEEGLEGKGWVGYHRDID